MLSQDVREHMKSRAHVGILRDHDKRIADNFGNATLGLVHEFGSPTKNIPEL